MIKVAVIAVYYGKLPEYYRLWLKSCEMNPTVDFYLVTDQNIEHLPENVILKRSDLADFNRRAQKAIRSDVRIEKPYKICDYKPMYGLIFEDFLGNYDYWADCDMDMIFGNLRKYFEKYHLEKYDKFLHLGHLSLYRNTEKNNNAFRLSGARCGSWEDVVSTSENCLFDEWNGVYGIYKENHLPMFEERIFADISQIYTRFRLALDDINYEQQIFYWQDGGVYRTFWNNGEQQTEEFIYIHFKRRKMQKEEFRTDQLRAFYIGPNGFTLKPDLGLPELEDVNRINPFYGDAFEKAELTKFTKADKRRKRKQKISRFLRKIHLQ